MKNLSQELSALLDEFPDDVESAVVLDQIIGDIDNHRRLERYQLIRQAMRHELPEQIATDFCQSVMSSINQLEPVAKISAPKPVRSNFWQWSLFKPVAGPVAGLAVAASVAIVSVMLWQSTVILPQNNATPERLVNIDEQKIQFLSRQPVPTGAVQSASTRLDNGMHWKVIESRPALEQKLNAYLVNHTEHSGSIQGLIPQARVAGFNAQ